MNINNLNVKRFGNIRESVQKDIITLTLKSDKLKKESKKKVNINQSLRQIIGLLKNDKNNDWLSKSVISYLDVNGNKLNLEAPLEKQGILKDTIINVSLGNE